MLIRQSVTPAPPVAKPSEPASAAPPAAPRRSIPLGLIIALNVVLLLAIALVLYFVFRPAPPDVTPGGPAPAVPTSVPAVKTPSVPSAPAVGRPASRTRRPSSRDRWPAPLTVSGAGTR
jgi:hypothetical protein